MSMKLNHLRDIVTVGELGSLRAAARHLGLAQPSITRSIAEVEREIGAPIFDRSARGVTPTEIGTRFLVRAASILTDLARAKDEAAQLSGLGNGRVSIVLSSVAHLAFYPSALKAFRNRFPKVLLSVREGLFSGFYHAIEQGEVDFYVGPVGDAPLSPNLDAKRLMENERLIFGRPDHPRRSASSLSELINESWMTTTLTQDSASEIGPIFSAHGLPLPIVHLHAQSSLSVILSIAHSDLLTLLPKQWVSFDPLAQYIAPIRIDEVLAAPPIYAVRRRQLPLTPAAQSIYDLILKSAANIALS